MKVDPDKVAAVISEIAETEIAPYFGMLKAEEIATKSGPNDFVTAADHAAEAALKKALGGIYPGATFIGEESAAEDPSILAALEGKGAFWIVDPLDGTRNFVQGRQEFATIVALVENGETRGGWIYAIPDKAIAVCDKGGGVTWRGALLKQAAKNDGPLKGYRAIGNLAEPWRNDMVPRLRDAYETEPARCSAYAYLHLVTGQRDFALYSRCSPWDHAAGVLMLTELGGRAAYLDNGEAYRPLMTQGRPLLAALRENDWEQVSTALSA